jgi:hypothetical protein
MPLTGSDDLASSDWKKAVRRNKLLGMWVAEKLGISAPDAEAYSDALAASPPFGRLNAGLGRI